MADISYTPTTWADGAEGGTPIDAAKLNNIEQGIVDAVAAIGPNDTTEDGTLKAQIDSALESVVKTDTVVNLLGSINLHVQGNLVTLAGFANNIALASGGTSIANIPSQYRPKFELSVIAVRVNGSVFCAGGITNNGNITVYPDKTYASTRIDVPVVSWRI